MRRIRPRDLWSWAPVALLALLWGVLAFLQYRWIGEISMAEHDRLRNGLQASLNRVATEFNSELSSSFMALLPTDTEVEERGREAAYGWKFSQWRASGGRTQVFRRVALVIPRGETASLLMLDKESGSFAQADWPVEWNQTHERLSAYVSAGRRTGPFTSEDSLLIESPRFGQPAGEAGPVEQEWLVVEWDAAYLIDGLIPRLLQNQLGGGHQDYNAQVVWRVHPGSPVLHAAKSGFAGSADASVALLDVERFGGPRSPQPGGGPRPFRDAPPRPQEGGRGRWQLLVKYAEGSLEAIVWRARMRNLAISAAILLLMIATVAQMVRYSRRAENLAEQQMNFVASVSHELRTPLTVIRTAAFNLRGKVAANPVQVERYGTLIQEESEKLTALVEQVLRFASTRSGNVIREKEPVAVENVIDSSLRSSRLSVDGTRYQVDKVLEDGLPLVLADEMALKHAIQNLLDNAVKYGTEGSNWIGISAKQVDDGGPAVEIRVSDRGPGIPVEELDRIFSPFFRGRRAVQDQIHGTGLGLNLVKKVVEAHGGTIRVESAPMQGTSFIVRIPAAPPELQDEFAHSLN